MDNYLLDIDEEDLESNPFASNPRNPRVLKNAQRKGARRREVTLEADEQSAKPLLSPDSKGARIAATLMEHNQKRAAAKKKEAERKAREAEDARLALELELQLGSKVEQDKEDGGGQGDLAPVPASGRVAMRERAPVPISAAQEAYFRQEKMCLRCVKEISRFPDLVCHCFNLASLVYANCDWKNKSCELVGFLLISQWLFVLTGVRSQLVLEVQSIAFSALLIPSCLQRTLVLTRPPLLADERL